MELTITISRLVWGRAKRFSSSAVIPQAKAPRALTQKPLSPRRDEAYTTAPKAAPTRAAPRQSQGVPPSTMPKKKATQI